MIRTQAQIRAATGDLDATRIIGRGGFGPVYRGELSGQDVGRDRGRGRDRAADRARGVGHAGRA